MAGNFFTRLARPRPRHISVFDGQDFKRAIQAGYAWLEQHRAAVNALNVFPVPDGDTGTNMTLTLRAATKGIADSNETSAASVAETLARGALMGARGNSGVILSQILRGFSQGLAGKETFLASDFAAALNEAARMAYTAVIKPVEGTILTVIREAAEGAQASAATGADLTIVLEATVRAARVAVQKTPDLLPTLKQAGVVDAGGQGLTYVLEGIWKYSRGEPVEMTDQERAEQDAIIHKGEIQVEEEFGYEVVFMLAGEKLDVAGIRDTITAMGGVSTVVAGDAQLIKVHTHTPTPGKILDYGVSLGSLQDINIENLQEQSLRYEAEGRAERGEAPSANGRAAVAQTPGEQESGGLHELKDIGVVAVVAGDGWNEVYRELGVSAIVPGGQTMNPSTEELFAAVENCPFEQIILLPNNGNVIMSARQVLQLTKKKAQVIPSDSMPQGVTALLAFNLDSDFDANCQAMEAAIKHVDTVEITRAVRSVQIDGVNVREGDIIGLVNGRLVTAGDDSTQVTRESLTRMGADRHEIVTIYYGEGIEAAAAQTLAQQIKSWFPGVEIEVVNGGQPYYAYIISAE
ncbi:MAG TPA: DAK2 domain-containing protein [Ktedonobacterales bacterium]|jgi:DAK2 domain fusion protein YloV|nr:DAK2 domain-containing protein [Ktedonobacterales bacterium]